MTTSGVTRKYWIEKAKEWAEERLSPPQADEFVAAINEVMAENEQFKSRLAYLETFRPISEAPRDGTEILVYGTRGEGFSIFALYGGQAVDETMQGLRWLPLPLVNKEGA